MRLAATLLITYIGVPSIYYGDEVGLSGGNDPDCRRCFPWDTTDWDHVLHDHYRRLIQLRRQRPALRRGDIQTLYAGPHSYVFARTLQSDQVVVACNRHPTEPRTISLPLWQTASPASRFTDAFNGDKFEVVQGRCSSPSRPTRPGYCCRARDSGNRKPALGAPVFYACIPEVTDAASSLFSIR